MRRIPPWTRFPRPASVPALLIAVITLAAAGWTRAVNGARDRIARPLTQPRTPDGSRIAFTTAEQRALRGIGIDDWIVPVRGAPHAPISEFVRVGDTAATGDLARDPGRSAAGAIGSGAGAVLGGAALSWLLPPLGPAVGSLAGGIAGQVAGEWLYESLAPRRTASRAAPAGAALRSAS